MQGLARYVFQSENVLCGGDHISWHSPLDREDSRLQHMLLTEDPLLSPLSTPLGCINFVQVRTLTLFSQVQPFGNRHCLPNPFKLD